MSLSRASMYWAVFLLHPNDEDECESIHSTGASARLRQARLNVEHPLTWADVETEVRPVLSTELPNLIAA